MQPLLDIKNLSLTYNDKSILKNINLKLYQGEIIGIIGESGSGKSSLIKAIIGLLNKGGKITNGKIYYQQENLLTLDKEKLRQLRGKNISMIFQNAKSSLCPVRTIKEQLYETVSQHQKNTKQEIYNSALNLFSKIGLKDGKTLLDKYPFELSGGMNQRISIALCMLLRPEIILADEPTSALDSISQHLLIKEMKQLQTEFNTSIIMVTHNIGIVEKIADKIAIMHQGNIIEYGRTTDIINNPQEIYTKKLLSSVLRLNKNL